MLESTFQRNLIKEIKSKLPGCMVMKNDANYIQGIPDLAVMYGGKWAMLECKDEDTASRRPNQDYYVAKANSFSFARFISPDNKEEVLNELYAFFGV